MRDKIYSYSKYVKEIHWPEVSAKKMDEINYLKGKIRHQAREPRPLY